jgi:hypothetical protein
MAPERAKTLVAALARADELLEGEAARQKDPETSRRLAALAADLERDSAGAAGRDQARLRALASTVKGIAESLQ